MRLLDSCDGAGGRNSAKLARFTIHSGGSCCALSSHSVIIWRRGAVSDDSRAELDATATLFVSSLMFERRQGHG